MSYASTVVEVLISSPSDVGDARDAVQDEIAQWNLAHARQRGMTAVAVRWETHALPQMGGHPQSILNQQLVDRCDVLVAVFGVRLGTPTPHGESGTAEEIERFVRTGKPVLVYKLNGRENADTDRDQLRALTAFLDSIRERGLFWPCSSLDAFRSGFRRHIAMQLESFQPERRLPPAKLSDIELEMLRVMGEAGPRLGRPLANLLDIGMERLRFHCERLRSVGLVEETTDPRSGVTHYGLTQDGRTELFERGLLK